MKKPLWLPTALCIALALCVPCFAAQNTAQAGGAAEALFADGTKLPLIRK